MNRIIDLKRKKKPDLLRDKKIYSEDEDLYLENILPAISDDGVRPERERISSPGLQHKAGLQARAHLLTERPA